MPHSPYTQTVLPRLSDTVLDEDRQALQRARVDVDQGVNDKYAQCSTLEIAEELLEHIDYLDGKISAKVCTYFITESRERFERLTMNLIYYCIRNAITRN